MKEIRSKIIAVSAVALFAVSAASCSSAKPEETGTVVVTNAVTDAARDDNSSSDSTEAPVPEKDDDGSQISVIEVTDAEGAKVTAENGKPVTELAVLDKNGAVVTNKKGENVKPNIKVTTAAERIVENKETLPPVKNSNSPSVTNEYTPQYIAEGPTVSIPDIEAKPGETVTFKVNVTGNTGYTALVSWIDINSKYFEFVSYEGGDTDDADNEDSSQYNNTTFQVIEKKGSKDLSTLVCLYFDGGLKSLEGDLTYATVTLKVKDKTPAGKYTIAFDGEGDGNGTAMCNNIVEDNGEKKIIVPTPKYKNGSITVK
ncbi:MAG: cohesin domain-containing protein [Oscillospiraceae bacterium]|nr:cohesin domain-containing protein [Oscillospiraceae bacterium]